MLILLLTILYAIISCSKPQKEVPLLPGQEIPSFTVQLCNGEQLKTESLKGKPTIVVFFNVINLHSRHVLEEMQRLYNHWGTTVNFLAVACSGRSEDINSVWNTLHYTLPVTTEHEADLCSRFCGTKDISVPQVFCVSEEGLVECHYDKEQLMDIHIVETDFVIPQIYKIIEKECKTN